MTFTPLPIKLGSSHLVRTKFVNYPGIRKEIFKTKLGIYKQITARDIFPNMKTKRIEQIAE